MKKPTDFMDLGVVKWAQAVSAGLGIVAVVLALVQQPYQQYILIGSGVLFGFLGLLGLYRYRLTVRLRGRLEGVISSLHEIRSFPLEANAEVFRSVTSDYCYLGITFASVLPAFRGWFEGEKKGTPKISLLLADPNNDNLLEYQARYELGLFHNPLSREEQDKVARIVARTKAATHHTLQELNILPQAAGQIEVRFHHEKLRKWSHYVNNNEIYVGILRKGESGFKAPVLVFQPRPGQWTLFDHFHEEWESLWKEAKPAEADRADATGKA